MSFNSFEFLVFFVLVTAGYFALPHKQRWWLLLVSSCIFYMYFIPSYILILLFTVVVDYIAGLLIEDAVGRRRFWYLCLSLVANVGVLAVFKYYNFITENLNALLNATGSSGSLPLLRMILPIGLSFHTFQAMSYTIEVYRGNQKAERHLGIYALYVMFYPQLVAGPIERPQNMLHQFHERMEFNLERAVSGLRLATWGFFKKIVVADRMAVFVNAAYAHPADYGGLSLLLACIFFTFQIYCDFSGYSDIALGAARVMGFTLMRNFDAPLQSTSITEFWRRWHISLSTWFNDYVFTPLYIQLRDLGRGGLAFALFTTFLISGLWHGAGWNFVVYGALHGLVLVYEALTKKWRRGWARRIGAKTYEKISWVAMFSFVSGSLIFFRSSNIKQAGYMIAGIANVFQPGYFDLRTRGAGGLSILGSPVWMVAAACGAMALVFAVEYAHRRKSIVTRLEEMVMPLRWSVYYSVVASILVFGYFGAKQFIYFQF